MTDLELSGLVIAWCVLHSWLISISVTGFMKRKLGASFRFYRMIYNFISAVIMIPFFYYGYIASDRVLYTFEGPTMIIQVPLFIAGLALLLAGARHYDLLQFTGIRQIRTSASHVTLSKSGQLDTTGILSKTRHPWYLAAILLVWSRGFDGSMFRINAILTIYVIIGTFLEERKLVKELGQAYRDYQNQVPMLFPTRWFSGRK